MKFKNWQFLKFYQILNKLFILLPNTENIFDIFLERIHMNISNDQVIIPEVSEPTSSSAGAKKIKLCHCSETDKVDGIVKYFYFALIYFFL